MSKEMHDVGFSDYQNFKKLSNMDTLKIIADF